MVNNAGQGQLQEEIGAAAGAERCEDSWRIFQDMERVGGVLRTTAVRSVEVNWICFSTGLIQSLLPPPLHTTWGCFIHPSHPHPDHSIPGEGVDRHLTAWTTDYLTKPTVHGASRTVGLSWWYAARGTVKGWCFLPSSLAKEEMTSRGLGSVLDRLHRGGGKPIWCSLRTTPLTSSMRLWRAWAASSAADYYNKAVAGSLSW